jgi:hypothetical protein
MVKRYRMKTENYNDTRMHVRNTGEWVKYEDYAALEAEHQKLLDAVIRYGHDPETLMELFKV